MVSLQVEVVGKLSLEVGVVQKKVDVVQKKVHRLLHGQFRCVCC